MKRGMTAILMALGMAALVAGGCANKEVVKSEDQTAATTKQEAPKAVEQAPATAPKTEEAAPTPVPAPPKVEESVQAQAPAAAAFETVFFDFDKSDLRKEAREVLNNNAALIMKSADKVRIEGHCDERGSAEYNLALGERRAKSVQQYLITMGVAADRLSVISYGKEKPAVEGHDEAAWAKNRRAEFFIVK